MMNSGMHSDPCGGESLKCYALVAYLPDPLATFLDDLRRDLAPGFQPHAHLTVLPPRLLEASAEASISYLRPLLAACGPFEVEMRDVEVFPVSDVIYLGIGEGDASLRRMHQRLNGGAVAFATKFPFHPHITLGQDLAPGAVQDLRRIAAERWAAFPHPRRFPLDRVWFVRQTDAGAWQDLEEFSLNGRTRVL